jgi:uncharacterized protein (TIGR02270 family)
MDRIRQSAAASIPDISLQHAENCSALWEQREHAVRASTYHSTFEDLARLDDRIDAQLDGLRAANQDGWQAAADALALGGAGELFVASVLAFETPDRNSAAVRRLDRVLEVAASADHGVRPIAVALDWIAADCCDSALDRLASEGTPAAQAAAMVAAAMRGIETERAVSRALESDCPVRVRAACWAAVRLGLHRLAGCVESHLASRNLEMRATAAATALALGSERTTEVLKELALDTASQIAEMSATSLFRALAPATASQVHRELFSGQTESRASLRAAAAAGVPELVPTLLSQLQCPALARLASASFTAVTGATARRIVADPPADFAAGPTEDPADDHTGLDPDEACAWADPAQLEMWWHTHARGFVPTTRYLEGVVASEDALTHFLHGGSQTTRNAAAALLARSGRPLFDVGAPAFRQRQHLASGEAWR